MSASLDIVLGRSWTVDARCLGRLYAYSGQDQQFDYSNVLDIIDIVVDGANVTSRIPEENIVWVVHQLVAGLVVLREGRLDKQLIRFQESHWEIALQRVDEGYQLSVYSTQHCAEVPLHNALLREDALVTPIRDVGQALLDDLLTLNAAFARERTVKSLRRNLRRLQTQTVRHPPGGNTDVANKVRQLQERVGRRRLAMSLTFDAGHRDLNRYHGTPESDLHSLLFRGSLALHYWGRRRVLAEGAYVFPLVAGLVDGVHRLMEAHERRAQGCVILDGAVGSEALLTAELEPGHVRLRITERCGAVGQTRTSFDEAVVLFLGLADTLVARVLEINPHQELNQHVHVLAGRIRDLRARFDDVTRGDIYFEGVQSYLQQAPELAPSEAPSRGPVSAEMPFSLHTFRRFFLRSVWSLERPGLDLRRLSHLPEGMLVPSDWGVESLDRASGQLRWRAPADAVLTASERALVVLRKGEMERVDVRTGSNVWSTPVSRPAEYVIDFSVDGVHQLLVCSEGGRADVFDLQTGAPVWDFELEHGELVGAVPAGPILAAVADDGFAYGLDPRTGAVLWSVRLPGYFALAPRYHQGRLYIMAELDPGLKAVVHSVYPLTGRRVYSRSLDGAFAAAPTFEDRSVILRLETHAQAYVAVFDLEEGCVVWRCALPTAHVDSIQVRVVAHNDVPHLVLKTDTGHVELRRLSDGEQIWATALLDGGDLLLTNVEVAHVDDCLVVAERYVSLLSLATGQVLYRLDDVGEHPSYLHVDPGLRMVVGEADDHIEALEPVGFLALM